jgi:hypothetical protein
VRAAPCGDGMRAIELSVDCRPRFHQSKIEGNSKYQSRRGFHKLCKEGRNAGL